MLIYLFISLIGVLKCSDECFTYRTVGGGEGVTRQCLGGLQTITVSFCQTFTWSADKEAGLD